MPHVAFFTKCQKGKRVPGIGADSSGPEIANVGTCGGFDVLLSKGLDQPFRALQRSRAGSKSETSAGALFSSSQAEQKMRPITDEQKIALFERKKRTHLTAVGSSGTFRACCGSGAGSSDTFRAFCGSGTSSSGTFRAFCSCGASSNSTSRAFCGCGPGLSSTFQAFWHSAVQGQA